MTGWLSLRGGYPTSGSHRSNKVKIRLNIKNLVFRLWGCSSQLCCHSNLIFYWAVLCFSVVDFFYFFFSGNVLKSYTFSIRGQLFFFAFRTFAAVPLFFRPSIRLCHFCCSLCFLGKNNSSVIFYHKICLLPICKARTPHTPIYFHFFCSLSLNADQLIRILFPMIPSILLINRRAFTNITGTVFWKSYSSKDFLPS